jgi:hypothetical protein
MDKNTLSVDKENPITDCCNEQAVGQSKWPLSRGAEVTPPYKCYYQSRDLTIGESYTSLFTSRSFLDETETRR